MRTVFIGDVHGCCDELADLLRRLDSSPEHDNLLLVGDAFARGPDPLGVWDIIAQTRAETVLGNHDDRLLEQLHAWQQGHQLEFRKPYTVEDLAVGQIRFDNGAVVSIEASFAAHIEKDEWNFVLMGEKGGASFGPAAIYRDDIGHMLNTAPAWLPSGKDADIFGAKMRNWVEHVLYDAPTLAPAEHGLMVQKMLDGIYASAECHREVQID